MTTPRIRMRGSVVVYLLCLSLVPLIGLGAFGAMLVHQSRQFAEDAQNLEYGMRRVQALDDLRGALTDELTSALGSGSGASLGLDEAALARLFGYRFQPVQETRPRTDRALARAARYGVSATALDSLSRRRAVLLEQAAALSTSGSAVAALANTYALLTPYEELLDEVAALETAAGLALAEGDYGSGNSRLSTAVGQLNAVILLVISESKRGLLSFATSNTGASAARTPPVERLRQADAAATGLAATLRPQLKGELAERWDALAASPAQTVVAAQVITLLGTSGISPPPNPTVADTLATVGTVISTGVAPISTLEEQLLAFAVAQGVSASLTEHAEANARARGVGLVSAALCLVTVLLLLVIGGVLRRRLTLLARTASRLSSGEFTTVQMRGPRELDVAAQGLNDAAVSLERVLAGAECLAAGDLTAPELSVPLEGRLGAAVSASFTRVTDAMHERELLRQELTHQATHDRLTGLPNRASAERRLMQAVEEARDGNEGAVLFVDLDHFKAVNDTYGHAAGDHVLQVVAERMTAHLRRQDQLCRLGGDEFVVVILGSPRDAAAAGARIVKAVSEPIHWGEEILSIGASVGIAVTAVTDVDADELLIRADHAVYRAKAQGRGTVYL